MLTGEQKAKYREMNRERSKKYVKIIWVGFGLFFFATFFGRTVWGPIGVHIQYSEGERKVQIVKVTTKGLFWKTYELEGIIAPGRGIATTYVWDFSIDNADPHKDELFQKINNAFQNGITVKVKYDQRAGSVPWRSKTTYFAKEVTVIE